MQILLAVLGVILTVAFILERLSAQRDAHRRRGRERDNLRHITGQAPWWKEPPGDEPKEDH
jgi:hypothetical protein